MKSRWFLVVIVTLLVSWLITGCGISQSQYDATVAELNQTIQNQQATQTQLQTAQSELAKTKTDLQTAQTQLQTAQSELAKTMTDLRTVQSQVKSLQKDQDAATEKRAETLSYAEFLDISMYELWAGSGIYPGFTFATAAEWEMAMASKATSIGDANLTYYIGQLDTGGKHAYYTLWYYCLDRIEQDLK